MNKDFNELAQLLAEKLNGKTYSEETRECVTFCAPTYEGSRGVIEVTPADGRSTIYHPEEIMEFTKFFELSCYVTVRFEDNVAKLVWRIY